MKLLYLTRWYPDPPENGASLRDRALISALAAEHEVVLVSFRTDAAEPAATDWSRRLHRVESLEHQPFAPRSARAIAGFASLKPRQFVDADRPEFRELVERVTREERPDAVVAWGQHLAPYAAELGIPYVYELAEFQVMAERAADPKLVRAARLRAQVSWWKQRRYARGFLRSCAACVVASAAEGDMVRRIEPSTRRVTVIPNGIDIPEPGEVVPDLDDRRLVYSGSVTFHANLDAVTWFARDVLPEVRRRVPDAHLEVTGRADGAPSFDGVSYTGLLPDVRPLIAGCAVCVVPLRVGSGTRLKILEALALGAAVVSTSKGAEGLELEAGRDLVVADEPDEIADQVSALLDDPDRRAELAAAGRETVAARYSWTSITPDFVQLIEQVATR